MTPTIESSGNYAQTRAYLNKLLKGDMFADLSHWGEMGVDALRNSSPVDSGLLESSWGYRIIHSEHGPGIEWFNTDIESGYSVAILIQYGHGTRSGTFVKGRDFINPVMQPLFDQIADEVWKKVST